MTTKEWLNRGWKLNEEINALLTEQRQAFNIACSITPSLSKDKTQTSRSNTAESKFINYASYSKMIDDRIDKLYAIKQEILQVINTVDESTYRTLLIERYIQFKTWEQIAVDMSYCWRQIMRLHGQALYKVKASLNVI